MSDDLALYVHWPYCAAKCPYCDFNSYARQTVGEERYLAAILKEIGHYAQLAPGRRLTSIFFGGGTPSLMSADTVGRILDHAALLWSLAPDAEITLEANPSSVEAARFRGYRAAGVNRVSIGVQSLRDDALKFLGRLHDRAESIAAVEVANATFERVSFDLIYARPNHAAAEWRAELAEALALARGHLSLYQLTIEEGTAFFDLERRGRLRVPEGDYAAALYEVTQEMCDAAGLPAYEISNHAAPGQESRHNLTYWRYGDYAGVGPGAHGRLRIGGERFAFAAERDPARWTAAVEAQGCGAAAEPIGAHGQALEMTLMGLRLAEGLDVAALERATGLRVHRSALASLIEDGLLRVDDERIACTRAGRLVLNSVVARVADALIESRPDQYCGVVPAPVNATGAGSAMVAP
ncbi:MAG: radical SAM family heme chaperone HemW [Hyphomicrobiales bacterium]|nr:radical SAM family heme chaperone HemW [Hyphomicrobiales bacterium]